MSSHTIDVYGDVVPLAVCYIVVVQCEGVGGAVLGQRELQQPIKHLQTDKELY